MLFAAVGVIAILLAANRAATYPLATTFPIATMFQFAWIRKYLLGLRIMQTYDLLMLLVLVCATMFGFWKGMAWQLASLASLVVSYIAALQFSERLAPTFGDTAPWNRFVAMLVIYMVTSFMIWTGFRLISGVIDKVKMEAFDKQLGAMFGFAKGVLLCVAVTFFAVTLLPPAQGEMIVGSQSGQYIAKFLSKADAVMPPEIHQVVDPYLHRVQQKLNPAFQASFPSPGGQTSVPAQSTGWSLPGFGGGGSTPQLPNVQLPKIEWPQSTPAGQQPAWPSQTQNTAPNNSVYGAPAGANQLSQPYSAGRPTNGTY
jgi:membrane protein required for colicin V production